MIYELKFTEDTVYTAIWIMTMNYSVLIYNRIPDIHNGLSYIEIWPRSRFELVSETLSICHVWGCPTYDLGPKCVEVCNESS